MVNKMENKNDVTMEKNYTVYMHVSPKGKRYIGITRNKVDVRWKYGHGYKHNEYFWRAIQKYEWNNFEHIIIENNLTKEQAENMEIELIAKYRSNDREYGYNIENGGNTIGTHSIETKKKIGEKNSGGNNGASKKVHCDNLIFVTTIECANYYRINKTTMNKWLTGKNKMNSNFQKLNLRYATENDLNECERYDINKHGDKCNDIKIREHSKNVHSKNVHSKNVHSKNVHCDNLIFNSIADCSNYYGINRKNMSNWLNSKNKMNSNFQKLNLRYATENDLNECERYDINKHGDKANNVINVTYKKSIYCNGIIFNSIADCSKYYDINDSTMVSWLTGKNKMPLDSQKLNLRYATENDLNKCEKYDINKHGDKCNDIIIRKGNSCFVYCDNLIFKSGKECAIYYGIKRNTMYNWLNGKRTMHSDFQKLNLRYATENDLNTYPRYTLANN